VSLIPRIRTSAPNGLRQAAAFIDGRYDSCVPVSRKRKKTGNRNAAAKAAARRQSRSGNQEVGDFLDQLLSARAKYDERRREISSV
jgi:hypothetical protein